MFLLTSREIRLLAFIVGAALLGVGVQSWRAGGSTDETVMATELSSQ